MSKCCWKNGTGRLAQCRAATNFQFVKNAIPEKCNKVKHNKTRSAYSKLGKLMKAYLFIFSMFLHLEK